MTLLPSLVSLSPDLLRQAVFVVGPTSVGKSEVAISWAQSHGGEIVNADAFQLYREFPILSAQPSAEERAIVPHHLFGSISCTMEMDAAHFVTLAQSALADVVARKKVPFVVGGSGLYLQALIAGLPALPTIDPTVREKVREMTLTEMQSGLAELDPVSLRSIDRHNPRRVGRRLELSLQAGRPASELLLQPSPPSGLRGIVLVRDRDELNTRIESAVEARLLGGAVEEVKAGGEIASPTAKQILGWREIHALLEGAINRTRCAELLTVATRQYAKRQLTWFRGKSTFPLENLSAVTPNYLDLLARQLGLS